MKSLYLDSGYLNIAAVIGYGMPYNFIWGGRGTGKTYGGLKYCIEHDKRFVFMRSLQTQLDVIKIPELSPFEELNKDNDWLIKPKNLGKIMCGFYNCHIDEEGNTVYDDLLGKGVALSTISNLRGFSASDVEIGIYDEFIPEKQETKVKGAGYAFKNAYETMNRNRELKGEKPIQFLLFSNSENLACDMFVELGLMERVSKMSMTNQSVSILKDRGIGLFNLWDSPISQKKADTALYKMGGQNTDYNDMALGNSFYSADYSNLRQMNLKNLKPICKVDSITIYEIKGKEEYFVSIHDSGNVDYIYSSSTRDITAFRRTFRFLWEEYIFGNIFFEDMTTKALFEHYFKEKA